MPHQGDCPEGNTRLLPRVPRSSRAPIRVARASNVFRTFPATTRCSHWFVPAPLRDFVSRAKRSTTSSVSASSNKCSLAPAYYRVDRQARVLVAGAPSSSFQSNSIDQFTLAIAWLPGRAWRIQPACPRGGFVVKWSTLRETTRPQTSLRMPSKVLCLVQASIHMIEMLDPRRLQTIGEASRTG